MKGALRKGNAQELSWVVAHFYVAKIRKANKELQQRRHCALGKRSEVTKLKV